MSKNEKLTLEDLKNLKKWSGGEEKKTAPEPAKPAPPARKFGQIKPKAAKTAKPAQPEESPPEVTPEDDLDFFSRAMSDVKPLNSGGRDIAPERPPQPPLGATDADAAVKSKLQDLIDGKIEFELDGTSEYIQGRVLGLDSRLFQKLKAGGMSVEAHLDLHGQNADQAQMSLYAFMRDSYLNGKRCILVIPGRGKNSPDGLGVLRSEVQNWLTKDPLKRVVLAFCTAQARHGGAGALYVLVRKFKQSQGKIVFDRFPVDMM